ncbi:MAG: metallophosphoesterase [Candidatus Latescibacterota bacterium]
MSKFRVIAIASLCLSAAIDADEDRSRPRIQVEAINPWTHLDLVNDPENFQFAIVTDRTGGHRAGVFPDAMRKINLLQPEFVMSVGDLIEGYSEDRDVLNTEWDEFIGFVEKLDMPFFYLPGNHDISNPVMAEVWKERFDRSYYHFVYRDVLFVCLNTEETAPNTITSQQADWVEGVLADNAEVRWTMVFLHKPLWNYNEIGSEEMHAMWTRIEGMLVGRKYTVFAGHFHRYTKHVRNESNYFVLATTGGGSGLRGPLFGEFDHVVWVTMFDEGPRIANLMLEGIWDENVRTKETAALLGSLMSGGAIAMRPVFSEEEIFGGATSELRLTNDADIPLHISARFAEHPYATVTPSVIKIELPPNSVELYDLEIDAHREASVGSMGPLVLEWTAEYVDSEAVPAIDGTSRLVVTREFDIRRRTAPVAVDGNLDEWSDMAFDIKSPGQIEINPDSWLGRDDCSWRFSVEMDDTHLYVAVDVTDERQIYKQSSAWTQDGLELRIDARPEPARSQGRDQAGTALLVGISPDNVRQNMGLHEPDMLEREGVLAVGVPTPMGHAYEVSVSLSYIEAQQGKDWDRIRINIAVDDFDETTGPLAQLWWQPDWRDEANFRGSGTFRRPQK